MGKKFTLRDICVLVNPSKMNKITKLQKTKFNKKVNFKSEL